MKELRIRIGYALRVPKIPLPPPAAKVEGVEVPTAGDARSCVGWRLDAYLYEWQTTRGIERWVAFWLAGQTLVQTPFLLFLYAAFFSSRHRRYYMNCERNAIVGIVRRGGTWRILDHAVDRPGSGSGKILLDRIKPHLLMSADQQRVPIVTRAVSTALADQYEEDMPGLKGLRRAFPRGVHMRREPNIPAKEAATTT